MTRFLHSADWQLGMTRHFLGPEAQARFTGARIDAVRAIGTLAVTEGCAYVVVCGDVFESNHVSRQTVVRALDAMRATPDVTFYLLPGNHDPLDAASVFRSPTFLEHRPENVVVLEEPGAVRIEPGVELVAAPWRTKRPLTDLLAEVSLELPADGTVRIAVGHGAVDTLSPDPTNPALVGLAGLEASIATGGLHYVALGDRHSATAVGSTGRIWYSGAPEPTDYVEDRPGNVLIVDVDTDGVVVEERKLGTWQFLREHFDLVGPDDCDRVDAFLGAISDKDRSIVKLDLVGQLSLADHARLEGLLEHHGELLAALETWERRSDLVVLPDEADFEVLELSGFASEALAVLREGAERDDEQAVVARDALGLLYRLASATR